MECRSARMMFSDYIDGELTHNRRQRLKDHLASCSRCREELTGLEHALKLVHSMPPVEVSPHFDSRLAARLAEERARTHRSPFPAILPGGRLQRLGIAGAALALLLALTVPVWRLVPQAPMIAEREGEISEILEPVPGIEVAYDDLYPDEDRPEVYVLPGVGKSTLDELIALRENDLEDVVSDDSRDVRFVLQRVGPETYHSGSGYGAEGRYIMRRVSRRQAEGRATF